MFHTRKTKSIWSHAHVRCHHFALKSGHDIIIYLDRNLEIYSARFNTKRFGDQNIGRPDLRELFGVIRRKIAEDINPDIVTVRKRVTPDTPYAWCAQAMEEIIDKVGKIVPSEIDDKILGKFKKEAFGEFMKIITGK